MGGGLFMATPPFNPAVCLNLKTNQNMESPGEGLSDLRQLIRAHVISEPIQEKLKECVSEIEGGGGEQKEELLMQLLEDKGLVDEVMAALQLKKGRRYRSSPPIKTEGESSATKHTRNGNIIYNLPFNYCIN